ncbi:MAG: DegQ family serine endoprotease [Salaquimonas sp.]|nr:DegQ family serine endoprotease [Salaquimonas sp.]
MRISAKSLFAFAIIVLTAFAQPVAAAESGLLKGTLDRLLSAGKDMSGDASEAKDTGTDKQTTNQTTAQVPTSREQIQLSYAPIVKRVAGSVVNVYAAREVVQRSPFAGDPFFERFFGPNGFGLPQRRKQQSLGSGVVVSRDGVILTNNHVVDKMDEVKVALSDGREFECKILLRDKKSDLAVLKINGKVNLQPIEIGDSDQVQVGDLVLAIGNPFGVGQTVTSGIVSAVSRSLRGINDYGYFIQTDAAINPGNSGGALVDMNGRLIGINSAIYSRTGSYIGLGYAIPSNMTQVILRSAKTGKPVVRPWLGADFQTVSSDIAESIGMDHPGGAIITSVVKKGPAEEVGLKAGDVVLAINGQPVANADNLGYRLDTAGVGTDAEFKVLSQGREKTVDIALAAPPETVPREAIELPRDSILAGASIANLSPAVAMEAGISTDKTGVVVTDVARNSSAAANGIRPGDILREVNGVEMDRTKDVDKITRQRQRAWQFVVERSGRMFVFERNGGFFRQYVQ